MAIDENKLHAFLGKAVGDLGAAMSAVLMSIGDELGSLQGVGQGAAYAAELAHKNRHAGTLRARMAQQPGRRRLRRL